jgi:hypothetical protein
MTRGFTRNALEYPETLLQPVAPSLFLRESAPLAFQFQHPTLRSCLHQQGLPSSARVFERVAPAPDRRVPTPPVLTVQQLRPYMKSVAPACDWSSNLDGTFSVGRSAFSAGTNKSAPPELSVEAAVSAAIPSHATLGTLRSLPYCPENKNPAGRFRRGFE